MIPDDATRRRALKLMRGAYHRLYGEARADAAAEWLLDKLQEMAERMGRDWQDHPDASTAEKMAAVLFLPISEEERGRLDAQIDAALARRGSALLWQAIPAR